MSITNILSSEHRVIEVVLSCLEKITAEANESGKLDVDSANQALDVIRTFADKCHHGKEENHLFSTLVKKGLPQEDGPIGQMLSEHALGRELVLAMSENVAEAANGGSDAIWKFTDSAQRYISLLSAHIRKEDEVLFPMADKVLSEEDQNELMRAFEVVESDHMGTGTHQKYISIVVALAEKYGIEASHISGHRCGCGH